MQSGIDSGPSVPFVSPPELEFPLPLSPTSSPLRRTVQLREDLPANGNSQPVWADEQRQQNARPGNAAAAVDLALAIQLRTGSGATADAAWFDAFRDGSIRLDRCTCRRWRRKTGYRKEEAARVVRLVRWICRFGVGVAVSFFPCIP